MPSSSVERALAYLHALEADQRTALELSKQKAEEAKLIKAQQDGFRAALEMLGVGLSAVSNNEPPPDRRIGHGGADPKHEEPVRRRGRRRIPQLILRELAFTGEPMTTAQLAKAVEYTRERTEAALTRMESAGQVIQNEAGRWAVGVKAQPSVDQNSVTKDNETQLERPRPVRIVA